MLLSPPQKIEGSHAMIATDAFAIIRRALNDPAFGESLRADWDGTLAGIGITDPTLKQELAVVLNLLSTGLAQQQETARLFATQLSQTLAVATDMKNGLRATVDQIDAAFRSTMLMYQISFYLGVLLVLAAIAYGVAKGDATLSFTLGGLGMADIIAFFLAKPPERLQSSRANLVQLQAALFNWFNDSYNQNTYLGMLAQERKLDLATMERLSTTMMAHTDKTMAMLQKYCKLE